MNKSARRCVFCTVSKTWPIGLCALVWKRSSNSYNISSFWTCSIKVDKRLRTYYKLSWKYVNTAKIISKVAITLSLINSNKDFDFVGWVIKTPCVFHFRSVKFHYVKETHDTNSLLTLVKNCASISARRTTKQIFVKICWQLKTPTRTWKCTHCTMQMSYSYFPFKNFCKLAKQTETIRNSAKKDFGYNYSFFWKLRS